MRLGGYEQLHPLRGAHRLVPRSSLTSNLRFSAALSERRGIINPRRGWQPCVAPYFADLGVGDMRGQPSRQYTSPPRRRWQAVSPRHSTPLPLGRPSPPIVYPSPLSLLRSPPRCKAAQALPSGHTHLESPCRPSRRSKQAQFPSSNSRCTTGRSATPAPPPRRRRRPTADISATPAGEAAVRSPCRGALRRFC